MTFDIDQYGCRLTVVSGRFPVNLLHTADPNRLCREPVMSRKFNSNEGSEFNSMYTRIGNPHTTDLTLPIAS